MKKIVALVGDYYHQEELARESLLKAAAAKIASGQLQIDFAKDPAEFLAKLENGPDAAILFAEDRIDPVDHPDARWMTTDISDKIVQYVEGGGGWLAWHSGLASYPVDSGYVHMLRGYFLMHPDKHKPVRYTAEGSKGADSFELLDEHYFVHCEEESTEVYLRSTSVDGQSIAGWRHSYGTGRVSCLTPAHRAEGLLDVHFLQWLEHEIDWTTG
ncbi:Trehalose utilization [compost metagenome]